MPYPRYYVGLALHSSTYQPLGGTYYGGVTVPVQLLAGYQLRSRLAVQASVTYSSSAGSYSALGKYYTGSSAAASPYAYFSYNGSSTTRITSTVLLARYTLTRQAAHRFQADLLGGFTVVSQRYTTATTRTDTDSTYAVNVTSDYSSKDTRRDLLLTAGASARYRFGRHLEALLDITLNHNLTQARLASYPSATTLGLRYRFGGLR